VVVAVLGHVIIAVCDATVQQCMQRLLQVAAMLAVVR
jgi:hypothetical protein